MMTASINSILLEIEGIVDLLTSRCENLNKDEIITRKRLKIQEETEKVEKCRTGMHHSIVVEESGIQNHNRSQVHLDTDDCGCENSLGKSK
tara:strand:+ start:611 stop:883 length:273 start_codon:yes stop_codon:yes gene_type:complete